MQSPRIEWTLGIAYLSVLDYLRNRGEPDGDTLTEVIREAFDTDSPRGRANFAAATAAGAVLFYRHICKPSMRG